MLEFNGKPIIEWQVETLRKAGVNDITIVTGYMFEKIKIDGVKYYQNNDYENTNMVETLMAAREELNGEVLICYADIIYEQEILEKIIAFSGDIGVTIDSNYWEYWSARLDNPLEDIESLVVKNNQIIELGDTSCGMDRAEARYVGLIKFSNKGVVELKKAYDENKALYYNSDKPWLNSKSFKKAYMTCMIQELVNRDQEVSPIRIQRGWLEFDTEEDYEKYNKWQKEDTLKRFFSFYK